MNIVKISEKEFWLYGSFDEKKYIPEGEYIKLPFMPKEQKEKFKNHYPLLPAQSEQINFCWLMPAESWIMKDFLNEENDFEIENKIDFSLFEENYKRLEKNLHSWQKNFLLDAKETLQKGFSFRKGLIAGLGAGKTLVYLLLSLLGKTLYIAPRHLHTTIKNECDKWKIKIQHITTPESAEKKAKEWSKDSPFIIAILDEALSCKNPEAQRTQGVINTIKNCDIIVGATATPLSVNPLDIRWINICDSLLPTNYKHFIRKFGKDIEIVDISKFGKDDTYINFAGETKKFEPLKCTSWDLEKLSKYIQKNLSTVDISDINAQIPEPRYEKVIITKPAFFDAIKRGFTTTRNKMKAIKQAMSCTSGFYYDDENVSVPIKSEKHNWIKKFIEDNPYEPIVIFSTWQAEQEILLDLLKEYNPACNTAEKDTLESFLNRETNILICSCNLSEGMNLQFCHVAIYTSYPLSPMKLAQSYGRLYRQGQEKSVIFYHLLCKNTLDESLYNLLQEHMNESDDFIEEALNREISKMWKIDFEEEKIEEEIVTENVPEKEENIPENVPEKEEKIEENVSEKEENVPKKEENVPEKEEKIEENVPKKEEKIEENVPKKEENVPEIVLEKVTEKEENFCLRVNRSDFIEALENGLFCATKELTRYNLDTVLVEKKGKINVVGTDGKRLIKNTIENLSENSNNFSYIISTEAVIEIINKLKEQQNKEISFKYNLLENFVIFFLDKSSSFFLKNIHYNETEKTICVGKNDLDERVNLPYRFPPYEKVIPDFSKYSSVFFNCENIYKVLTQMKKEIKEDLDELSFKIENKDEKKLFLEDARNLLEIMQIKICKRREFEVDNCYIIFYRYFNYKKNMNEYSREYKKEVLITSAEKFEIKVNFNFFFNFCKKFKKDWSITFYYKDSKSPLIFEKSERDYCCLIEEEKEKNCLPFFHIILPIKIEEQ